MRILLITDEEWNDAVYGNNVLTNWFTGLPAEYAQIYCSPGLPSNGICHRYFRVTDAEMVRSVIGQRAGSVVTKELVAAPPVDVTVNAQRVGMYKRLKTLSTYIHTPMMMVRDTIWLCGRYDKKALQAFVDDFCPDIVFCPRLATPKLMRLERIVSKMTAAPFVAFTADNEASYHCYSFSPLFWLRRWYTHRMFGRHVKLYRHYFTFSSEQAEDYRREYGLPASCLYKCGDFEGAFHEKRVGSPIRLVYAGRLYCNRWKTLSAIGDALKEINREGGKMVLDVYTQEELTAEQREALCEEKSVFVRGAVTPAQLREEYAKADVALHVESFDKKNRSATRYSFSTKIIDLMASSCAIMAICWERHAGYAYLKDNDAAICVADYDDILPTLKRIAAEPQIISRYARKAWECGSTNHSRESIQNQISETFNQVIKNDETSTGQVL